MDLDVISTEGMKPNDRLPYWNDKAANVIAPVVVEQVGDSTFDASLQTRKFGSFNLMHMRATPSYVRTNPDQFDPGMVNLTLLQRGKILSRTAGIDAELTASDMIIYDYEKPMEIQYPAGLDMFLLQLPRQAVMQQLPALRQLVGRRLCGSAAGVSVFSRFLIEVWNQFEEQVDHVWQDDVGSVIWPMLKMAYSNDLRALAHAEGPSAGRRAALTRIIDDRLCDPELSTEILAQSMGMSQRNVQILFAQIGTTPTGYIRNRRLDLAAHLFAGGAQANSVTEVCYGVGFGDLSTFCRSFRKRFGVAPSQYRLGLRSPRHRK